MITQYIGHILYVRSKMHNDYKNGPSIGINIVFSSITTRLKTFLLYMCVFITILYHLLTQRNLFCCLILQIWKWFYIETNWLLYNKPISYLCFKTDLHLNLSYLRFSCIRPICRRCYAVSNALITSSLLKKIKYIM